METVRQQKVARLIQKEVSSIFQKDSASYYPGGMISITVVRVSPDFSLAKIYLSIFPSNKTNDVLKTINESKWRIRHDLGQSIRKQLRQVPEIAFFIDDSCDYIEKIDNLLNQK